VDLPVGNWVRIIVNDTGVGIQAEALPHIFEPFYTTKPAGQGTGLGLAQVYGIVKQHDGYIDVFSTAGCGTTFTIYLPAIAYKEEEAYIQEPIPLFDGAGATVLLVEDDLATRDALRTMLETHNFNVLAATNGVEALSIFNQERKRIALIISDIVMPRMGGMALYREIKKQWKRAKILLITGHPLGPEDQASLEKGTVHWLQKPFSMQDFSLALHQVFTP
jgi:CheY-like chemotaxis protein